MKTQIFLLIVMAFVWAGCQQSAPKNSDVEEAELTICLFDEIKDTETVPLSKFVENCTLVQFENTEEAHITPQCITVTDKYIGVRQQGALPYKIFDRSGKFLCSIDWVPQVSGGYLFALHDDFIDDKNELVYLTHTTGDRIPVFKTTGEFVKYIKAPREMFRPVLHLTNEGILAVVHLADRFNKTIAFQFDANGKVIKELEAPDSLMLTINYSYEIYNTCNTPAFSFLHTRSDTLYHYNLESNKLVPIFTINFGAQEKPLVQYLELPHHYISSFWKLSEKAHPIVTDDGIIQGYYIRPLLDKGLVCTDKRTKSSSYIKIVHDELGNMEVPAFSGNFRNGYYVYTLHPKRLIDNIEKRLQESGCTGQDKEKLNALLSKLDENANNVTFIGKLKQ